MKSTFRAVPRDGNKSVVDMMGAGDTAAQIVGQS